MGKEVVTWNVLWHDNMIVMFDRVGEPPMDGRGNGSWRLANTKGADGVFEQPPAKS
jgi:hypothetical protein